MEEVTGADSDVTVDGDPPGLRVGRFFLGSALFAGVAAILVEAASVYAAIDAMRQGSCTAALIGVWSGAPLTAMGVICFAIGAPLVRLRDPRSLKYGIVGLVLALVAVPLGMWVGFTLTDLMNLG